MTNIKVVVEKHSNGYEVTLFRSKHMEVFNG